MRIRQEVFNSVNTYAYDNIRYKVTGNDFVKLTMHNMYSEKRWIYLWWQKCTVYITASYPIQQLLFPNQISALCENASVVRCLVWCWGNGRYTKSANFDVQKITNLPL